MSKMLALLIQIDLFARNLLLMPLLWISIFMGYISEGTYKIVVWLLRCNPKAEEIWSNMEKSQKEKEAVELSTIVMNLLFKLREKGVFNEEEFNEMFTQDELEND